MEHKPVAKPMKPAANEAKSLRQSNVERSSYFARREAAKVFRSVLQGDAHRRAVGSIKTLVYSPTIRNKKATFALVCQTLKFATETSASGSNADQSGRSSAAPITSNRPIRKRVKSADRREMLESFVNNYRAMNLGKFPSPTNAQKEVGGGYYSIKKMLQEMEYVEKGPTRENKKQIKCDDAVIPETTMESSESQEKSNGQITIEQNFCEDPWLESGSSFDQKTGTRNSNIATDDNHNIATENDEKPKLDPRDDSFAFKDSESKVEKRSYRIRNVTREKGEQDNKLREKASLWGNLKSLANEFMNMWKK